ncbi:NAD(P)/FAD-dependent oxidoreductase [Deinococcus sp. UYEF24]
MTTPLHDTIVIGGGPAGLSAALHLAFHQRDVLVLDRGSGPLRYTTTPLWNVPGFVGKRGTEILKALRGEAETAGAAFLKTDVTRISGAAGDFLVETATGQNHETGQYRARTLLLATGVARHHPLVGGQYEPWLPYAAKGNTYYCPDCEAPELLGQDVLVIGVNSPVGAASVALTVSEFAAQVRVLLTGQSELPAPWPERLEGRQIGWQAGEIASLEGKRGHLDALTLESGVRLSPQAYFVVGRKEPRSMLAAQLGLELSAKGHVQTGWRGQTNVPGVWAAGDVQPQTQQVSVALGSGNMAAVMIDQTLTHQGLRSLGTGNSVRSVGGDGRASHLAAPVEHASNTGF